MRDRCLPMTVLVGVLAALSLCACPRVPAQPPTPVDTADAGAPDAEARHATCGTYCARARALGCDAGRPTPAGAPCETVCGNANGPEAATHWPLACMSTAESCDAQDACMRRRRSP